MKIDCGPTWAERVAAKEKWHLWFAWLPIRLGSRDCRWLEQVWRKGDRVLGGQFEGMIWQWNYKPYRDTTITVRWLTGEKKVDWDENSS